MKHLIATILLAFLAAGASFAQDCHTSPQDYPASERQQVENGKETHQEKKRYPSREELQSQKIAFFTQELELTPEEAQRFWPVYNEAGKRLQAAKREINTSLKELHNALKAEQPVSDSEVKLLMNKYFKACEAEIDVQAEIFEEISKVLPVQKAAKTFSLEEKFRIMLIRQLRK